MIQIYSTEKLTQTIENEDTDDGDLCLSPLLHQVFQGTVQLAVAYQQPHVARHSGQPQYGNSRHDVLPIPQEEPDDVGDVVQDESNEEGGREDCGCHVRRAAVNTAEDVGHSVRDPASLEEVDEAPDGKRPWCWSDFKFIHG